jgi:hypothetical protein
VLPSLVDVSQQTGVKSLCMVLWILSMQGRVSVDHKLLVKRSSIPKDCELSKQLAYMDVVIRVRLARVVVATLVLGPCSVFALKGN